ncbi:MAG: SDR family oxidoreductase [Parcubacteria group bacterium]|nr:SDR family oxidoreductase [Parcubacteria group bacterium]
MKFKNAVVVITGAASGLGRELAVLCVKGGAKTIICDYAKDVLEKTADDIDAYPVVVDVTNEEDVMHLVEAVVQKYGSLDVWMNNAGVWLPHTPVEELDMKKVHHAMEVNAFGTMYGSKAAYIQMRKQNSGVIINVISISALSGRPGSAGYCATKYAASGFTKSLVLEAQDTNIKIIGVYPDKMKTHLFDENKPEDYDTFMEPSYVAKRIIDNLIQETPFEELIIKH